jgi:hypothetical protein
MMVLAELSLMPATIYVNNWRQPSIAEDKPPEIEILHDAVTNNIES